MDLASPAVSGTSVYANGLKYIGVVNLVVWLYILLGPSWCMSVAVLLQSCFNVNFNILFEATLLCISW